jgi:hypothetical protein
LLLVGVGAADYAEQEFVSGFAWGLAGFREILKAEEDAFGCAATHLGGEFELVVEAHWYSSDLTRLPMVHSGI